MPVRVNIAEVKINSFFAVVCTVVMCFKRFYNEAKNCEESSFSIFTVAGHD